MRRPPLRAVSDQTPVGCSNGTFVTLPTTLPGRHDGDRRPTAALLAGRRSERPGDCRRRARPNIKNEDFALFVQDKWQIRPNFTLSYGLRWEAQIFPESGRAARSKPLTGILLNDPRFPSDGTLHRSEETVSAARRLCLGHLRTTASRCCAAATAFTTRGRTCCRRWLDHDNGVQQQTIFADTAIIRLFGAPAPVWPGLVTPRRCTLPAGVTIRSRASAACACSAATTRTRASTRRTSHFEQEIAPRPVALSSTSPTRKAFT